jgi:hypothetical protein
MQEHNDSAVAGCEAVAGAIAGHNTLDHLLDAIAAGLQEQQYRYLTPQAREGAKRARVRRKGGVPRVAVSVSAGHDEAEAGDTYGPRP